MKPTICSTKSPTRRSDAAKWRRPYFRCKLCGGGHWKKFDRPGCSSVASIAINRVTDDRAEGNWSTCVVSAGAADPNTGGSGSDICPAGPSPRLRSDAGLTARLRLPQLATGARKQNRIPVFSNARQGGIYRRRRVADPWGTVCREYNVRSALNECRTAYAVSPCNALCRSFASRHSRLVGAEPVTSRLLKSTDIARPA
jgi:hypothetical protein